MLRVEPLRCALRVLFALLFTARLRCALRPLPTFDLALAVLAGIASLSLLSTLLYLFALDLLDPACGQAP